MQQNKLQKTGSCVDTNDLASRGHEVWGLDFIPVAIERANVKAKERGLGVHFQVGDSLKLDQLGRTFDTVIDCGLFHTFADEERPLYVSALATVVRPGGSVHILCFSDQEPPGQGPSRVTQQEIRDAFRDGWEVQGVLVQDGELPWSTAVQPRRTVGVVGVHHPHDQ